MRVAMWLFMILLLGLGLLFGIRQLRQTYVTGPIFRAFKRILPPLSKIEKEAMEAGDTGWDAELFSGSPNWHKLHAIPKPKHSAAEQLFIDTKVKALCGMLDDYQLVQKEKDLPKEVWNYLAKEGFFSLIIPKSYGGLEFSALANSTIVAMIATRSLSAAVTVMVPNSLGPGELLMHYGTEEQKKRWLPGLAKGEEIPCFALTGPDAGSDAGSIPDQGTVCKGMFEGKEITGIRLSFDKRYITLAPVATVVGLAFKLSDPEHLLGERGAEGITCALIPADFPGLEIGNRHNPLNLAFMNGPLRGKDLFIPLDWIIGGPERAGQGWRMLLECLSAGRGISLPALSTGNGHLASRMSSAYAYIRKQFGTSIGQFEGVQEALARIGGYTYILESTRKMTAGALDLGARPAVITAIAKCHMTELSRTLNADAMDIHAGRGIQLGPNNYIGQAYMGIPVSITVEGANILTRSLMIFGQGATRCHPYLYAEMKAASEADDEEGLNQFEPLLAKHLLFTGKNLIKSLFIGLLGSWWYKAPVAGETAPYYGRLSQMSSALALCSDLAMLMLGGKLKRKEMLSARLGDLLSHLYMASSVLKHFEDDGHQQGDLPFVHYALNWHLNQMSQALRGFIHNFPNPWLARLLRLMIFPWGERYQPPADELASMVARAMMTPGVTRERLTHLCWTHGGGAIDSMEKAFLSLKEVEPIERMVQQAIRSGEIESMLQLHRLVEQELLTPEQAEIYTQVQELRAQVIAVDEFEPEQSR